MLNDLQIEATLGFEKLVCESCQKEFLSKSALKAHIKFVHQHLNVYPCPQDDCKKFFNTQYRLEIHMLSHKGVRPFKCELCHKSFTEQGTLRTHLVTHSSLRPFQCEICKYKCKTCPQLRNHYKKEHNDNHFYKCKICFAKFNKKAELKHHTKAHEKMKKRNEEKLCSANDLSTTATCDENFKVTSEIMFSVLILDDFNQN